MRANWKEAFKALGLAGLLLLGAGRLGAQTPLTEKTPVAEAVLNDASEDASDSAADAGAQRVRISDNIGFYYFVSAGYVTQDASKIPVMGEIIGDFTDQSSFSTAQKVYVRLSNAVVKPGDFLVVYRVNGNIHQAPADDLGRGVENLGIVEVKEVQKDRCLTVVKESFAPFAAGDLVKSYGDEIARWKQAQRRKVLPSKPIRCFVASGPIGRTNYDQNDWVVLTAGQKEGVVEGQVLKLREYDSTGFLSEPVHQPVGDVQVFYVGQGYSMAQILRCSEPITNGFEAWYQP
jgi:hypothetical protein